jgi:hypothetical protein
MDQQLNTASEGKGQLRAEVITQNFHLVAKLLIGVDQNIRSM